MTNAQFKKDLNAELAAFGSIRRIKKVTETGVNTTLVFKTGLDMKTVEWLNNRFSNGISLTDTDHSLVFINTPAQRKTELTPMLPKIKPLKKGDNLTIIGRRWFDRVNGNTYFSAVALVNGIQVAEIPFEYGYGNQYEENIYNLLFKLGYCADREIYNVKGVEALWSYCKRKGITKYVTHSDVNRKKDL